MAKKRPNLALMIVVVVAIIGIGHFVMSMGEGPLAESGPLPEPKWSRPPAGLPELQVALDSISYVINQSMQPIEPILERSCFDCHTNRPKEPWYYGLPGIRQMIADHVEEGREHLDMSNGFPFSGRGTQLDLLHEIYEEVDEGKMPLSSYLWLHSDARIEGATADSLFDWVQESERLIKAAYEQVGLPVEEE